MKKQYYLYISLIGVFSVIFSCKKVDFDKIAGGEWNPMFAVPLAYSTFDVYDIFAKTDSEDLVIIDPNSGSLALIYRSNITALKANELLTFNEDYTASQNLNLTDLGGVDLPNFTGNINFTGNEILEFDFNNGEELKEIKFDGGTFNISVSSNFQHPVTVDVSIPSLVKNGVVFSKTMVVNAASGSPQTATISEALNTYIADLTLNNTDVNKLNIQFDITVNGNGNPINQNDDINLDFGFHNLEMDYVKGYLGTKSVAIPNDTILLKIFQFSEEGHFELINPKIKFDFVNSFGMPTQLNLNSVMTYNINTGQNFDLLGYMQQYNLAFPSVIGDSAISSIQFDKNNTANIENVVEPTPKYLLFNGVIIINPAGNSGIDNFISKNSELKINSEVELPLHGLAHSFKLRDTLNFSTPSGGGNLESVLFRVVTDNGFPINVFTKFRFLDGNYQEVFEIDEPEKLLAEAAPVDNSGKVISSVKRISDLKLNKSQVDLLEKVEYIEIIADANTKDFENGKNVKIYDTYKLDVKLAGKFEYNF